MSVPATHVGRVAPVWSLLQAPLSASVGTGSMALIAMRRSLTALVLRVQMVAFARISSQAICVLVLLDSLGTHAKSQRTNAFHNHVSMAQHAQTG